jgi:hypothetical protein
LSRTLLTALVACVVIASGCSNRQGVHQMLRQNAQAPDGFPKVLAVYMAWFGEPNHINVGYSSHDPAVLGKQIDEARDLNISAFVVDWYGDRDPFVDQGFALLQQAANQKHFHVALLYNETQDEQEEATDDTIVSLNKAYKDYIGPDAPNRAAYLQYNNRPVIFIFPKGGHTNWEEVRRAVSSWQSPPLLIYKDHPPNNFSSDLDGYYAWVHPGHRGWASDGSEWGEQYLEDFYKTMSSKYSKKITVGAAWPGFNDTRASWGLDRRMNSRCGETFQNTLQLYHRYYDTSNPLPFLLVETWNDYEEGTAIERSQRTDCPASQRASK